MAVTPPPPPSAAPSVPASPGGSPLAPEVRRPLEKSFGANLHEVRVHSDAGAHSVAHSLSTRAVTIGSDIFLGRGERPTDMRVMAHEAAHVIQQRGASTAAQPFSTGNDNAYEAEAEQASAAVLRGESFSVQQTTAPRPQGLLGIDLPDPLDWLANKANVIPGFRMFTIILGVNPINMSPVARSAANILRALIEFLPGGGLITQALDNSGVFEKAGAFVEKQIASLGMTGSAIKAAVTAFIARLSLRRIITDPGGVWADAKRIFTEPIDRIKAFGKGLVTGIIELIKDAILKPIAKLAEGTEGYNLLKGILGKDPITGEPVTRSAENLLGPLLRMIGLGDVWQKMQQAKAIPRAWAWFQSTMGQLVSIVSSIPSAFLGAFKSLTLEDIILVPKAFIKLGKVFVGFVGKFVSWGLNAMWELLKIVFDVVSPGAWGHIQRTGAALKSILKNPLPFVGNLVRAAKAGFLNFGANFVTHLKAGLLDWLVGSLPGVYIPKALSLVEFGKLALSVFGITWAQIRAQIVTALGPNGETIMRGLELAFDVIKALITGGPAAAWELIKDKLTNLKDMIVDGIVGFIKQTVVQKAIPKLIAMFIPGAGFISAIISIYDTVMVFVNKISRIIQVVTGFINSIVAIAAGNIGAAAAKVESVLAGLLALVINFLAGFVGLGNADAKIREVINNVRTTVSRALFVAINWIVTRARSLFASLFTRRERAADGRPPVPGSPEARLAGAIAAVQQLMARPEKEEEAVETGIPAIARQFTLRSLRLVKDREGLWHTEAEINPKRRGASNPLFTRAQLNMLKSLGQQNARLIHAHRAEGWPVEYRGNKRGFLRNADRVVVGRPVEVAGALIVEQLALDAGLSVLRNVGLQFIDGTGANVGGVQHELDFVIVGASSVVEIISAKTNPGQLSVSGDQGKLAHMRDLPTSPQQLREYAIQNFVGRGSVGSSVWNRVVGAFVVFNDRGEAMRLPVADFRSRYLARTAIEKLSVRSLAPAQPEGARRPDIALAANSDELLDQLIIFIDAALP